MAAAQPGQTPDPLGAPAPGGSRVGSAPETGAGPAAAGPAAAADPAGPGGSHFLALVSRMRYIERWALMRSSRSENLAEHSLEVAMVAHMLCTLGNVRHGRALDADHAAVVALYHDASEIVTGDMPTPVKYHDGVLRDAYKQVEHEAEARLLATLPDDLRPTYERVFWPGGAGAAGTGADGGGIADADAGAAAVDPDELYLRRLVKAADKISALLTCVSERQAGNTEFRSAEASCRAAVDAMAAELPEVADFLDEFLPSYGATLDELI